MTTYTASLRPHAVRVEVPRYRGTTRIYWPVTQAEEDADGFRCTCESETAHLTAKRADCPSMAGGSHYEDITCPHQHLDEQEAETCVRELADAEVRRRNAATA